MKKAKLFTVISLCVFVLCTAVFAADFEKSRTYTNNFSDVPADSWYSDSVASVYEIALMEGVSDTKFDTESEISVAQAITIAARLHSIYNDTQIPDVSSGRWFQKYVNYCLDKKIITANQFDSYTRSVLSFEMVELFASALPKEYYPAINNITYVHDVPSDIRFHDDVLMFYNAGILNGNDSTGTFLPMSAITRKRAAVILSRTAIKEKRQKFTLEKSKSVYSAHEIFSLVDKQTVKETLDDIILAAYGGCSITASEYRYYSFLSGGNDAETENSIKDSIATEKYIKDINLTVSAEDYQSILVSYYSSRISNYGNSSYFDALDSTRLTDAAFAKLIALDKLDYLARINECKNISADEVLDYVTKNNYICVKNLFISKESDDAYRTALGIYMSLSEGEDFDTLLKEQGEDPVMSGGNSGYIFTKGMMEKPFENAAYELKTGKISEIVETSGGYHILKRVKLDKQTLISSHDYTTISAKAGSLKFSNKISDLKDTVTLLYVDNFEGLSEILK